MLDSKQKNIIRKIVEKVYQDKKALQVVPYPDEYTLIVRVQHQDPGEADFDPFVKVDVKKQTVEEFNIIHDADDPAALLAKFQEEE